MTHFKTISLLLIWISIFTIGALQAQQPSTYFNKAYHIGQWLNQGKIPIEIDTGGYYVIGSQEYQKRDLTFTKFSEKGDTVWTKVLGEDSINYFSGNYSTALDEVGENGYVMVGSKEGPDSIQTTQPYIMRLSKALDTVWTRFIGNLDTNFHTFYGVTYIPEEPSFLIAGAIETPSSTAFRMAKMDTIGNFQWRRKVGGGGGLCI